MKINNERGVALIFTLFFLVITLVLEGIFILNVIHEAKMARVEREQAQSSYAAHGGAQAAIEQVETLINTDLQNTISSASPSGVIAFAQSKITETDGLGWLISGVRNSSNVQLLTQNGEEATYAGNGTLGGTNYSYNIAFTEKSDPIPVETDAWDFPFSYRIDTTSTSGSTTNKTVLNGDFTVRLQRDNFAKFALFSNNQKMPSGTNVWFTNKTNFIGPVFTNDRFNFALNPSGSFQETIAQYQPTALFYNNNNPILLNADANGTIDVPYFNVGFTRNAAQITLNPATNETNMIDQVKGTNSYGTDGIYLPAQGSNLSGGIYIRNLSNSGNNNCTITLAVDSQNRAVYTIDLAGTTKVITVDQVNNETTISGVGTPYTGKPDGADDVGTIFYVDGKITGLGGTVQKDTEITIASHSDIVLTDNLKYTNYTSASGIAGQSGYVPPSGFDTNGDQYTNLLGLVSWAGNVRIGTSAPNDVEVHGTVMAQNGIFTVDNYNSGSARGIATLLGGAISNNYGAFGTFNGRTGQMVSGYGRNFVYDSRMGQGKAPPYFPSLNTFIAFTNDITDKIVWQEGE